MDSSLMPKNGYCEGVQYVKKLQWKWKMLR